MHTKSRIKYQHPLPVGCMFLSFQCSFLVYSQIHNLKNKIINKKILNIITEIDFKALLFLSFYMCSAKCWPHKT